ncbi:hypothetical protein HDV00_007963 [Rhizophlyctis rosea]|nr:hypothetical protein HDV00_007963 [Rhizophlyctis rosea]
MAVGWVIALLFSSLARSACEAQLYWLNRKVDVELRGAISSALYVKSLRKVQFGRTDMSPGGKEDDTNASSGTKGSAKSKSTTGKFKAKSQVANLFAADTEKILHAFRLSHYVIFVPLLIAACMVLLIRMLGWAALFGLGALSLAAPLTIICGKWVKAMRKTVLERMDARLTQLGESLHGIKTIKMFAWEPQFILRITKTRTSELRALRSYLSNSVIISLLWRGAPILATFSTFTAYALLYQKKLDPTTVFTALAIFNNVLRYPLFTLPKLAIAWMEARVSLGRVEEYLGVRELERFDVAEESMGRMDGVDGKVGFRDATFQYHSRGDGVGTMGGVIRDLTLEFPNGGLTLIVGPIAAGKSSLLLALLGEMQRLQGIQYGLQPSASASNIENHRTGVAYVSQQAWLQNATIRENILFGSHFDQARYTQVIKACALLPDLELFPAADGTEIGERGITLSGGQRQRVALARAAYSNHPIILLDDPLSAVDAPTAQHLLHECILGPLMAGRTRLLVTHAVNLCLPYAVFVVVMEGGRVLKCGPAMDVAKAMGSEWAVDVIENAADLSNDGRNEKIGSPKSAKADSTSASVVINNQNTPAPNATNVGRVTTDETKAVAGVKWSTYKKLISALGGFIPVISLLILIIAAYAATFAHDYTLKEWTSSSSHSPSQNTHYLTLYALISLTSLLLLYTRLVFQVLLSNGASKHLHSTLINRLFYSPLSFFESTPAGRILNRFGKDLQTVDQDVVNSVGDMVQQTVHLVVVVGLICVVSPWFLVGVPVIFAFYLPTARKYLGVSRDLKRLESITRSPIYSAFDEVLSGGPTIRAFHQDSCFLHNLQTHLDTNQSAYLLLWASNRWLAVRIEMVGAFVTFATGLAILFGQGLGGVAMDAGWAGLCLTYAVQFTDGLMWWVRNHAQMELTMNSVERLEEWMNLEQEAPPVVEECRPSAEWPSKGNVEVRDLVIKYKPGLNPALRDLTLRITGGQRIAIVGRTGAGKSTLSLAFLRMLEATSGSITIDGIPIHHIGTQDLRRNITVVPQDPVMFSGNLRFNLDPIGEHDDALLWDALREVSLATPPSTSPFQDQSPESQSVARHPITLDADTGDRGANLSVGERQLVALARAIVRTRSTKGKVVILDEATASVDSTTDALVQKAVANAFVGATLITIAHRLRTVFGSDRVVVLDRGRIVEDGSPAELLDKDGLFKHMCEESGELAILRSLIRDS